MDEVAKAREILRSHRQGLSNLAQGEDASAEGVVPTADDGTDSIRSAAAELAQIDTTLPPVPNVGLLPALIGVIVIIAVVFVGVLILNPPGVDLTALLVGGGSITAVLGGIAATLALSFQNAVKGYDSRAGDLIRIRSIGKILRDLGSAGSISPETAEKILVALIGNLDTPPG